MQVAKVMVVTWSLIIMARHKVNGQSQKRTIYVLNILGTFEDQANCMFCFFQTGVLINMTRRILRAICKEINQVL